MFIELCAVYGGLGPACLLHGAMLVQLRQARVPILAMLVEFRPMPLKFQAVFIRFD